MKPGRATTFAAVRRCNTPVQHSDDLLPWRSLSAPLQARRSRHSACRAGRPPAPAAARAAAAYPSMRLTS